jgi:hypothetical protein
LIEHSEYNYKRDVVLKVRVRPGFYLVIPTLNKGEVNMEFALKIITEEPTKIM